jgi:hypothetical protein
VRQHILQPAAMAVWSDGTAAARYEFTYALYQQIAYQRLGIWRCVQLHRHIGIRLEEAYGPRVEEVAAELAQGDDGCRNTS